MTQPPPTSHFCHPHLRLSLAGADPGDLPAAPPGNFAAPGGGAAGDALGPHQPPPAGTALRPVRAEFQGYVRRTDGDGDSINVPVYRCFWSGRTYRLEIGGGQRPYHPGETVTLYRDQRNGSVV